MAFHNRALAGNQAAGVTGTEASEQDSNNVVAGSVNEWINQQQRSASLFARTNGALDGSLPYDPFLIDLPSASRVSEQNFFDLDFGQDNLQFDADAQTNAEMTDNFPARSLEHEPEQDGNFAPESFDEDTPDTADTSSELVEEQTVAVIDHMETFEPNLVSENEMHRSPQLPEISDVEVPGSRSAPDFIALDSQAATDSTPQLVQSQVPRPEVGAGAGPQHIPNAAGAQNVLSVSAANLPGNQIPRAIAPNVPNTTGVQQPPATTNTGGRRGRYLPKIQTRPPRTRGPLQQRPIPVWPEFLLVTPAVRANAAGHEAALRMITHARNVPSLKTVGNTDLITSSTRTGGTPGDWKPVVIANFLNEWIRRTYNGLELWKKEGKSFREQINWYDRRPLMEQADIRIFITEQVEALLPAADQQRIAQLRQNFQPPNSQLTTQVANGTWQPPIFGPPTAAFLALVAAHDAAAQINSGTQMNQMGSGLGAGPVVGTGVGPSSSQPAAGSGGFGANSLAASGIQAPHPALGANPEDSRKRNRDDAGSDDVDDSPNSRDLPAPPPTSRSSFAAGMNEQPGHLAGYGAPYPVAPYPVYNAPALAPYGHQLYPRQPTPGGQSAHQTYDAPQFQYSQEQFPHQQILYDQPAPQHHGSPTPDPWMQFSNPAGFDFQTLDPALFELPGLSSGASLATEDDSREVPDLIDMRAQSRQRNTGLIEDEADADRIEAYWRNEESRARGGLAARPEVFGFGPHGPGRHQRGSSIGGCKRGPTDDGDEEDGDGYYSLQEKARGKRHREL